MTGFLSRLWARGRWALICGLAVTLLAWIPVLAGGRSILVLPDAARQTYPWWVFGVDQIQNGELPVWDPYTYGGRTHLGEGQEGALYPPYLLAALLGRSLAATPTAINIIALFHMFLGFAGAYALARALHLSRVAALTTGCMFAVGLFFADRAGAQLGIFHATSWIPLALAGPFLYVRHRRLWPAALTGTAIGMSVLAGHAQPALHGVLVIGAALLFIVLPRRNAPSDRPGVASGLAFCAVAGAIAFLIAAAQLLPLLEYQRLAVRWVGAPSGPIPANSGVPYEIAILPSNPALHVRDVPSMIFGSAGAIEGGRFFIGTVAFLFGAVGLVRSRDRVKWLWFVVTAVGVFLALGESSFLFRFVHDFVPLMNRNREPQRFLLLAHIGAAVIAGIGVEALVRAANGRRVSRVSVMKLALCGAAALALVTLVSGALTGRTQIVWDAVLVLVIASMLFLMKGGMRRLTAGFAVGACMGQLMAAWWATLPPSDLFDYEAGRLPVASFYGTRMARSIVSYLDGHPGNYRVDLHAAPLPPNLGDIERFRQIWGYSATAPARYYEFVYALTLRGPRSATDFLGARYVASTHAIRGGRAVVSVDGTTLYEMPHAFPEAWFVGRAVLVKTGAENRRELTRPQLDLCCTATVELADDRPFPKIEPPKDAGVNVVAFEPKSIRFATRNSRTSLLVTSEQFYPGWRAYIDGRPTKIYLTDYAFRGVVVPPGRHTVEFRYQSRVLMLGIGLSVLGVFVVLAICIRSLRERRS